MLQKCLKMGYEDMFLGSNGDQKGNENKRWLKREYTKVNTVYACQQYKESDQLRAKIQADDSWRRVKGDIKGNEIYKGD